MLSRWPEAAGPELPIEPGGSRSVESQGQHSESMPHTNGYGYGIWYGIWYGYGLGMMYEDV